MLARNLESYRWANLSDLKLTVFVYVQIVQDQSNAAKIYVKAQEVLP